MYRHFAVLTLAATFALAMFSSGENRQAMAREVAAPAKRHSAGSSDFARKPPPPPAYSGTAGDGFDGTFGQPMDTVGATAQDGVLPAGFPAQGGGVPAGFTVYGVSAATWASLTTEERKRLMGKLGKEREAAASPHRAEQVADLLAASRARSGGAPVLE